MPAIKVFSVFHLQAAGKSRMFGKGIHYVTEDELYHPFTQGMIKTGKAQECAESLLPQDVLAKVKPGKKEDAEEGVIPTREDWEAMDMEFLRASAEACGIVFAANIGKAKLIDRLMAGLEEYQGCPVVFVDGEWVIKDKEE